MPGAGEEEFLGRMGIVTGWGRLEYGEQEIVNNLSLKPLLIFKIYTGSVSV